MHRDDAAEHPIAVVGAALRLPGGVDSLDGLWAALTEGRDLVGEVPPDRFDAARFVDPAMPRTGKSYTAAGGFLDDIAGFDAAHFGISPKEAAHMDPQHRLLLELTGEALDDAAIAPALLAGTDTAVYVGISDTSYGALQMSSPRTVGPYTMAGAAASIAANRVSYTFDLRGPSMAIDTACSSSLVALDRACRTLLDGTSRTAVCGGVNALLSPFHYIGFSQASMLSSRGRCASFSANGDGFVRAEGGGVVLLKRLADALADGDRVHGVILGTGANSDGRTMGMALPNPDAQESLLREVYRQAGVHPDELVYFEAHGTGTPVGDPLEARAIGRALGIRRITGDLPIGSVKSNLGHMEPASGMAGLFKALLVLRHGTVPASLHAEPPHPGIDFAGLGLTVATRNTPVARTARPVVGVNSFGFGGANAHAVLTCAPPSPQPPAAADRPDEVLPVLVSARTAPALVQAVAATAEHLRTTAPEDFYDLAHTSCLRRGRHEHRAVVLARTPQEAAREFALLAEGAESGGPSADATTVGGTSADATSAGATARAAGGGRIAFVYSGNGSQWAGMGADLLAADPVFRAEVERVDAALSRHLDWSVAEALAAPADTWRLERTEIAQPLLFAVQAGLTAVLRDHAVEPAAVIGHSVGEAAAAYACGAYTLEQAARVVAARSRLQGRTAGQGRMAALGLPAEQAADELARHRGALEIAGVNSPEDVTVAGDADALAALGRRMRDADVFFRDLDLDYAFHSPAMDGLHDELRKELGGLAPAPVDVPLYSTVTGHRVKGTDLDAEYWWRNVRQPVRFHDAVRRAVDDGAAVLVEIGPRPVLRSYLRRIAAARPGQHTAVLATLRRDHDGPRAVTACLASVVAAGADTDLRRYFPRPGRVADLPAYPWQRERHWDGTPQSWIGSSGNGLLQHPLLGERLPAPVPVWEGAVEPVLVPWLTDHRIGGTVVMPATGYAEMAFAAGRTVLGGPVEVEHLAISNALLIPWADASAVRTQVSFDPDDGILAITSTDDHSDEPRPHARARVRRLLRPRPGPLDPAALRDRCGDGLPAEEFYASCTAAGLGYGPAFQVLRDIRTGPSTVLAAYHHDAPGDPWTVHPALLDGALQAGVALLLGRLSDGRAHLPASVGAIRVWGTPAPDGLVHVVERSRGDSEVCWDITVADEDGTVTVQLLACRLRRLPVSQLTPVTVRRTVLRAASHPGEPCAPSPLPAPAALLAAAEPRIDELRAAWRQLRYERFTALGRRFTACNTAETLAGLLADPAGPFTVDDLVAAGMQERHGPLITLLAPMLERHGLLTTASDGRWRLAPDRPTAESALRELTAEAPAIAAEIALTAHQARRLGAVLRGTEDSLGLLLAEPSARMLEQYYDVGPTCRFHNRVARTLVEEMVRHWPAGRPLRILEVGAGTGGTTAALLPVLPADRTHYCFSDVSSAFFARAQSRFAAHDFVDYRTLDLDADPAGQDFTEGGFDLVVAAYSLHTAKDVERGLRHLAALLAPGGRLLGIEVHDAELIAPIFGTLDSFHHHTDTALRPDSPLLPRDRWPALLERAGFTGTVLTGDDAEPARGDFSVFLAAAPTRPALPSPVLPQAPAGTRFLVAVDGAEDDPVARAAVDLLAAEGAGPARLFTASTDPAEWTAHLGDRAAEEDRPVIALVLAADEPGTPADAVAQATRTADVLRAIATAYEALPADHRADFWLVTRPNGATPGPEEITHPTDAAAWGIARCLVNEEPRLAGRRLSLHRGPDPERDARRLVAELLAPGDPDGEDEIVLTAEGRFVPREKPHTTAAAATRDPRPCALRLRNPGLSYELFWQEIPEPAPGPGEVVLDVKAAALNYHDIMQAVGLLPSEVLNDTPREEGLGLECAGVVTACGPDVTGLAPGDRVAGLVHDALATRTVGAAKAMWRIPDHVTFAEAATMPVAFCTVHQALLRLAGVRPGETVLVHGAAGGVGLAALQYAQDHGATVIATAGSDLKRDLLRGLGVAHVLDSRSLDFTVDVMEITGGEGVDIVLNSLSGEAITRGLDILRPGGRFIELGKRDIYEDRSLPLRPFSRNIAFHGLDLATVLLDPRLVGSLLEEVDEISRRPGYRPLLHAVFPAARVDDAFRLMQHSRHVGKVVVALDPLDEPFEVVPLPAAPVPDPDGTYLVTGGTSGFGAATADWLADLGARHLVLVSRSGERAPGAAEQVASLTGRGVAVSVRAADAADLDAMRAVLDEIDAGDRPLRGVVHCAMHLDDAALTDLTPERIAGVLAPKLGGAAVLDRLTRGRDLDLFLLYSSETALVGNFRQSSYVAANLHLEAVARLRRQRGETACTVAWGAIAGTGYTARNDLLDNLANLGIESLAPRHALATAGALLAAGEAPDVVGVSRSDWGRVAAVLPRLRAARLRDLVPARTQDGEVTREELLRALAAMDADEVHAYLTAQITTLLADVLHMDAEQLDPHLRLDTYGMDSLMAAQLLVALNQRYDMDIPPLELLRSNGTIAELARIVQLRLGLSAAAGAPVPAGAAAEEGDPR